MICHLKIKFLCFFVFFLCVVGCFSVGCSASAFSVYNSVEPTGNVWRKESNTIQDYDYNSSRWNDTTWPESFRLKYDNDSLGGRTLVNALRLKNTIPVKEGYYYSVPLYYQWGFANSQVAGQQAVLYTFGTSSDFDLVDYDLNCNDSGPSGGDFSGSVAYTCFANFLLRAKTTKNANIQLGLTNGTVFLIFPSYSHGYVSIDDVTELVSVPNSDIVDATNNPEYIQNEKEDLENQKQESEDTANDESSGAQDSATSLLDVVIQFISTVSSATPSSCNLDGSLIPHLPLGVLNLCQNSPPPAITALGSILLIGFIVPLCYHLVKRMLGLIGSFQN